jgi:protein TonB
MAVNVPDLIDYNTCKGTPFAKVFLFSVIFHVVILVGIPLLARLMWAPRKFERPKTFQLVPAPRPAPPKQIKKKEAVQQRVAQEEAIAEAAPLPSKNAAKKELSPKKEKEAARPKEENLEELASLLEELPSPAQVSAIGEFKYNWYLTIIQQKLEKNWNPSTEDRSAKVQVAFTINSSGMISEPKITRSSGNRTLDNLALRAVKMAAPFPKLPPGFSGDSIELNCTLIPTRK